MVYEQKNSTCLSVGTQTLFSRLESLHLDLDPVAVASRWPMDRCSISVVPLRRFKNRRDLHQDITKMCQQRLKSIRPPIRTANTSFSKLEHVGICSPNSSVHKLLTACQYHGTDLASEPEKGEDPAAPKVDLRTFVRARKFHSSSLESWIMIAHGLQRHKWSTSLT